MPNAVLDSLRGQRAEQLATMDAILGQVEGRDLVDAEKGLLEASRDRIAQLDAQIKPLEEYESLRGAHSETLAGLNGSSSSSSSSSPPRGLPAAPRRADGLEPRGYEYRSAGEFVVDYLRAQGILERGVRDEAAYSRMQHAYELRADQKTPDTPGILPTPIVGAVINLIDSNRPLISSLGGAKPLGGIPGATFTRPKISVRTAIGPQAPGAGEKTALTSQKMTIGSVSFAKQTYGGFVDISRQDIDWTSPGAWDILVRDLADVYAVQTETAVAAAFLAAAPPGQAVTVDDDTLAGWSEALYEAAAKSYSAGKRMPTRVWCSLDVWARLGSLVDTARLVMPPAQTEQPAGSADLGSFRGDVIGLPRIVVPTFASGTCIVGPDDLYEVYEEVLGLLSVIEPSILGVEVAYGGYVAWGTLEGPAHVRVTPPAGMRTFGPPSLEGPADEEPKNGGRAGK